MRATSISRRAIGRLELLLALSVTVLLFELYPSLWLNILWAVDIRNWSRGIWLFVNAGAIVILIGSRFGPELYDKLRQRGERLAADREKHAKLRATIEQRQLLERVREAQKRRVY